LNFDECVEKYEDLFDPNIREFYGKSMFSSFMWTPKIFSEENCWQNHMSLNHDLKLDSNFRFIVYSKFVIQEDIKESDIINFILTRFEKSLPLINIDVIILTN